MRINYLFTRSIALCAVAAATTACNLDDQLVPERVTSDPGRVAFACEVDPAVSELVTRADAVPEGMTSLPDEVVSLLYTDGDVDKGIDYSKLALRIWGTYDDPSTKEGDKDENFYEVPYAEAWDSIEDYYEAKVEHERGFYFARIESRPEMSDDKIKEGVNNPYFVYETKNDSSAPLDDNTKNQSFRIKALETTNVEAELKLMNSCLKLQTTQALMDYYAEIELTLHTKHGSITYNPSLDGTATTAASGTTGTAGSGTTNTNDVVAWDSYTDGGEALYFFNVSEPVKIDEKGEDGLIASPQSEFTTELKLSGKAKKQNGFTVYFTKDGKPDGEPVSIALKKDGSPITLEPSTLYTITVGHTTAGTAGLTITYNGYEEAEKVEIIELRPDEEDTTTGGGTGGTGTGGDAGGTGGGTGTGGDAGGTGGGSQPAA